jgi:hypothetical protein
VSFLLRIFLAAACLILGFFTLSYLQSRFDHGDEVRAFEALRAKFPELTQENCRMDMASRWRGVVRIRCGWKSWLVDVVGAHILEEKPGS